MRGAGDRILGDAALRRKKPRHVIAGAVARRGDDEPASARGGELWCEAAGPRVKIAGYATLYLRGEIFA